MYHYKNNIYICIHIYLHHDYGHFDKAPYGGKKYCTTDVTRPTPVIS